MSEELKPHATSNGTNIGYTVEARVNVGGPASIAGQVFDDNWRSVDFKEGSPGVPGESSILSPFHRHYALYSYQQAQALRWWFMAACNPFRMLETRLRRYRVEYTSKCYKEDGYFPDCGYEPKA